MRPSQRLISGLAICLVGSCQSKPTKAAFATRDSAGVVLIETSAPLWADHAPWQLATMPHVTIGTVDGPEEYQLDWIWDALLLGSGDIVVGNAGSQELRFYDSLGKFVRRAGRKGEGPGEFGQFALLRMWRLPGGRLLVGDAPQPRGNIFDTTGTFVRTITLAIPTGVTRPSTSGSFADGTLLVSGYEPINGAPGQVEQPAVRYFHYGSSGEQISLLARVASAARYAHQEGNVTYFPYLPFTTEPAIVADSSTVLLLRDGSPEIERLDLNGRTVARIRWQAPRRQVTSQLYKQYVATELAGISDPGQRRAYEAFYKLSLPLPDLVPAYRDLYVDETRHIWVERYRLPWEAERVWDVLDRSGRWLGALTLPGRFWLHRAGERYLLGTQMDSLDVERVQLYPLSRTTP